jgi:hypothetical protein
MRRMDPALISVFDNRVVIDVQGPASSPGWEMVCKTNAVNIFKFGRYLGQSSFKSRIMIAKGPEKLCVLCYVPGDLIQAFLTDLQLIFYGRDLVPTNGGMPTNGAGVENVPVHDDDIWF